MKSENSLLSIKRNPFCIIALVLSFFTLMLIPMDSSADSKRSDKIDVYVVNYPLKYFTERIGGDAVEVHFPAPVDVDPAYWNPDLLTVQAYQKADLILLNGAGYARWIKKTSLPPSKIVNTSKEYKHKYIMSDEVVTHSHGSDGAHAHESLAFTTWLDFDLAARQARAIMTALSRKMPSHEHTFQQNYAAFEQEILALDLEIMNMVAATPSLPLIASHPVYDYFARRYTLNLKSVHWEPDEIPTTEQWLELQRIDNKYSAKWMVWEGDPMSELVKRLKSMGIDSLVFNPCGNVPQQGDFMSVMKENIRNLSLAFPETT